MRTIPLVLVAAIVLAGCATSIDDKKAEKFIATKIEEKTDIKVKSVSCPSGLTAKKGSTFECTVTREDGTKAKTRVTETDAKGNVTVDLSSISSSTPIDQKKAEGFIAQTVTRQTGARVESVSCPGGQTAERGATFDCTVTGSDGTTGTAKVTEQNDQGDVHVEAPFLHPAELEQSLSSGIAKQVGGAVQIVCPDIVEVEKGRQFECKATSGSESATVKVTQTDDQGHVDYKVEQ